MNVCVNYLLPILVVVVVYLQQVIMVMLRRIDQVEVDLEISCCFCMSQFLINFTPGKKGHTYLKKPVAKTFKLAFPSGMKRLKEN